jgi:phosphoglycolate phosphatase
VREILTESAAFIFDLDGTLFDSSSQIYRALCVTRIEQGMPAISFEEVSKLIGLRAEELFASVDLNPKELSEAVSLFRRNLETEIAQENVAYPESQSLLSRVNDLGFAVGIATSKPNRLAEMVVKNSDLDNHVSHIQGTDGFPPKPNPEVVIRCMSALGVTCGFMVGDRVEDVVAGNSAGLLSIGVAQSHFSEEELRLAGAFETFGSIAELNGSLKSLIARADLGSAN